MVKQGKCFSHDDSLLLVHFAAGVWKLLLCNLAQVAFMMQLWVLVMKKKTIWVSSTFFRSKLEISVEAGVFYHQNTLSLVTWYLVPLEGQCKVFCNSHDYVAKCVIGTPDPTSWSKALLSHRELDGIAGLDIGPMVHVLLQSQQSTQILLLGQASTLVLSIKGERTRPTLSVIEKDKVRQSERMDVSECLILLKWMWILYKLN